MNFSAGVIVKVGDQGKTYEDILEKIASQFPMIQREESADLKYSITGNGMIPEMKFGIRKQYLIFAVGKDEAKAFLDRAKGSAPKWLSALKTKLTIERRATLIYTNMKRVKELLVPLVTLATAGQGEKVYTALGLDKMISYTVTTGLENKGFVRKALLEFDGDPPGIFSIVKAKGLTTELLAAVPADASYAFAAKISPADLFDRSMAILTQLDPAAKEQFTAELNQTETAMGFKLREDFCDAFGDRICIFDSPGEGGLLLGTTMVIQVKDHTKAQAVTNAIYDNIRRYDAAQVEAEAKIAAAAEAAAQAATEAAAQAAAEAASQAAAAMQTTAAETATQPPAGNPAGAGMPNLTGQPQQPGQMPNLTGPPQQPGQMPNLTGPPQQSGQMPNLVGPPQQSGQMPNLAGPSMQQGASQSYTFDGKDLFQWNVRDDAFPFVPSFYLTEKEWIVSLNPQAIKAYLNRASKAQTLADVTEVKSQLNGKKPPVFLAYQNSQRLFDLFYPVLLMGAKTGLNELRKNGIDLSFADIPSARSIRPHLIPSVSVIRRTDNGIECVSYEAIPGATSGLPLSLGAAIVLPAMQKARATARDFAGGSSNAPESAKRAQTSNNLKIIGLALQTYHDANKKFPGAFSADSSGQPLLSWRVSILPFIDEIPLYQQFHLNEPWDSEHNKTLIDKMPACLKSPLSKNVEPGKTNYLGVRGEHAFFKDGTGVRVADIPDGLSHTIAVVEADDERAVTWTKPDDYAYDPENPSAGLGGLFATGFNALFSDGSVQTIGKEVDKEALKAFFTRDGKEPVKK